MVAERGLEAEFVIRSAATSAEEIENGVGNPVYPAARAELEKHGISPDGKRAVQLQGSDYDKYDLFIGMDSANIRNISLSSHFIGIGSHGYEHADASKMNVDDFQKHIHMNIHLLKNHPKYVPFHAYTWGRYTKETNDILKNLCVTPVYVDGMKNYNVPNCIHREIL